jgi:tRNA nucleotidyltransferase/poly(A) polymerase
MNDTDNASPSCDPGAAGAAAVVRRLREQGHRALFAGGCVRDRLLGDTPSDYDVATDASSEAVQRLFPRTVPVGARFGVVLVLVGDQAIEVATFRADAEYADGRHPVDVSPANAEEDAQRRDFTINGMFLDPESGEVLDYVGGRADLKAGVIRAIGDPRRRFEEDRLRMLRAVRLAARLGYVIEPSTFDAIRRLAPGIHEIALERIGDEIVRILTEGAARRGFELLDETGLLDQVLPEIAAMKGVAQSPDFHPEGDVFRHTLLLLDRLPAGGRETLALGALLHDVAKPLCAEQREGRITFYGHAERGEKIAVAICRRLRRSREVWERVGSLVRGHLRLVHAPEMRRSTLLRFLAEDGIEELLELARIDSLASHGDLRSYEFCRAKLGEFAAEPIKPPPLLRGGDLLALGYPQGPLYGEILREVETRQLEGELGSRDEALAWVRETYPRERGRAGR